MTYILESVIPTKVREIKTIDITDSDPLLHYVGDLGGSTGVRRRVSELGEDETAKEKLTR